MSATRRESRVRSVGAAEPGSAVRRNSSGVLLREVLLTVGAVAGLICLLAAAAAVFFGVTPVIFRSGSMAPSIDTGALALTRSVPIAEVRAGEVVSVFNAGGQRVTHRVDQVISAAAGSSGQLILKGDANALPDPQPYVVDRVDRVFFSANGLGYAVAFLQTPWAIFAGGIFAGMLVFLAFRPPRATTSGGLEPHAELRQRAKRRRHPREGFPRWTNHRKSTGVLAILLVPLAVFGFSDSGQATLAAFTDSSVATGGTVRSARLLDITGGIACKETDPDATITWNPAPFLPPEGSYALQVVRLKSNGSVDSVMGYYGTAAGVTTFTFTPSGTLLGLLSGATTFRINIFSVLVAGGGLVATDGANIRWSSAVATVGNRTILSYPGLIVGLGARIGCDPK